MGCISYLENSRRGGHLWLFWERPLPGDQIRQFGHGLLHHFDIEGIELFPKQDRLHEGLGSMIRLPFGVHRKSGKRYGYYTPDGQPLAPTLRVQIRIMDQCKNVPEDVFTQFTETGKEAAQSRIITYAPAGPRKVKPTTDIPLWQQIKDAITVRQFVLQYVELTPRGQGLCPFHDDHVASFHVNDDANFWKCFACDIGGSVIDFTMHWRGCDFQTAVTKLAEMLLEPDGLEFDNEEVD